MKSACFLCLSIILPIHVGCLNPFAPRLDSSVSVSTCDPRTIDGVFQCFQASYSFRDTVDYGKLLSPDFIFVYRDYEQGIDVSWGRDDEMRTTNGLFSNSQRLDLVWNATISTTFDSTRVNIIRGFNLTITFNPNDIERISGYANLTLERHRNTDPWKIIRWRDESNF